MLKHHRAAPAAPSRAAVIGAGGFVGRATVEQLRKRGVEVAMLTGDNRGTADRIASELGWRFLNDTVACFLAD